MIQERDSFGFQWAVRKGWARGWVVEQGPTTIAHCDSEQAAHRIVAEHNAALREEADTPSHEHKGEEK